MRAVNGVSFSAYEGEITALLGHNGAGKTTTMSVLTGMFSPTSGSAFINGHNIITSMDKVRQSLGLCPQHNMLFEDLNVNEHLRFFGMLKGMSSSEAAREATTYIEMLNLEKKKNVNVTNLSGGMKRKVNLGIALIGNSKVVMLDEPTSGMDPEARREMWDLLNSLKKGRTILLTTHFMEEADVLGDRIAIMGRGRVKCFGTPFFLKKRFGHGYTLHIMKGDQFNNIERCTEIISGQVPGSTMIQDNDSEATYRLDNDQSEKFPDMFLDLEKEKKELDIVNFGLDLTTMDDVFLKIGELDEPDDNNPDIGSIHSAEAMKDISKDDAASDSGLVASSVSGLKLILIQLYGLLVKRMIYTWRRKILYISMMTQPITMAVFIVLSLNPYTGNVRERPARLMDLGSYTNPKTYIGHDGSDIGGKLQSTYKGLVTDGTTVLTDEDLDDTIIAAATGNMNLAKYRDSMPIAADFEKVIQ